MTSEEKANELVEKFLEYFDNIITVDAAIQCAIIAVDEIIDFSGHAYIHGGRLFATS